RQALEDAVRLSFQVGVEHADSILELRKRSIASASVPLCFALALPASGGHSTDMQKTPQQVADTLDSIVQPRFQKNVGRFGVDRIYLGGHDNAYDLVGANTKERRQFQQINSAHRPYVVAFLHCAHKPGQDRVSKERGDALTQPSLQVLATATATENGSGRLWQWADANLFKVTRPALTELRQGYGVNKDYGNWYVVMRPVRALHQACLGCHAGAKQGDTLAVMVYAVDKNTIHLPLKSTIEGEP
ncbi:MAG: hypothetical protein ACRYFS_12660, partial [Janthinobacterium lividum]